ncbi:MAG TPA: hypothetical protein VH143_03110 [Kofleriaceae bacterium]|jgi:hypothetical protein|nr:hypothetical protein [Kofleriaceae bacterium]
MTARALVIACCLAACHGGGDKKRTSGRGSGGDPFELVQSVVDAAGPSGDEIEPNDSDDKATPLALGQTLRGKLEPDGDVDRFRITVAVAGALAVTVSPVDADLALELEDGTGNVVAKSDRGGMRTREGVPNFGVQPGSYIAVVREVKHKSRRGSAETKPAPVYEIAAQMAPAQPNAEHEPDDDRGTANELIVGDTGTGYIGWSNDVDVWKLSVEAIGAKDALDYELSAIDGIAFDVELDDGVGQPLVHRKAARGAPMIVRGLVPAVPAGAPPFEYVTIKATGSNPETPYSLRVSGHVVGTDAEIEPDDTPDHAMAWPADRTVVHGTWTPGDVDCYALAPGAARAVSASIEPSGDIALIAELLVDGNIVATSAGGGKGAAQKLAGNVPANGHAVVRIKGAEERAAIEGTYDVTVQDGT